MQEERKRRIPVWLYPSSIKKMDELLTADNCKSQSEFIENAIRFYTGYVASKDSSEFLCRALVAAIRGTLDDSENRIARLLFKLAVELDMTMNIVAAGLDISETDLTRLRGKCITDVKKTGGSISFDQAARFQNGT